MVYTTEGAEQWFITPYSSTRARRWLSSACTSNSVSGCSSANDGSIQYDNPTRAKNIRPTAYLKETVIIIGGNGTESNPYILDPTVFISGQSPATCAVTTGAGYATSKTLTIGTTLNGATLDANPYSWTSATSGFGSSNQTSVSAAGNYWAYIKDNLGRTNSCSITIRSRQEYLHNTCTLANYCTYCPSGYNYSYSGKCFKYRFSAESDHDCTDGSSGTGYYDGSTWCYYNYVNPVQGRNVYSCGCQTWDNSDTTWYTDSCGNNDHSNCMNRQTRTTYGQ
jgi:hypothetical protein